MVGNWRGELTLNREISGLEANKGQVLQEDESYAWGLDRKFIVVNRIWRLKGKEVASATDFIGYDPESKKIKQWGFYSTGGHGSGLWRRADGGALSLQWSIVDPEGKKHAGKFVQKRIDEDTIEGMTVDQMDNGEKLPDTPKTISRRVKE